MIVKCLYFVLITRTHKIKNNKQINKIQFHIF